MLPCEHNNSLGIACMVLKLYWNILHIKFLDDWRWPLSNLFDLELGHGQMAVCCSSLLHIELLEQFNIDLCDLFELSNLPKVRLPAEHDNSLGIACIKLYLYKECHGI